MSGFNVVSEEELHPVLDRLLDRSWPIPMSDVPDLVAELGWTLQGRRTARSTLPVSLNIVSFLGVRGEIGSIMFRLSDTLPDESVASKKKVMSAFPGAKQMISSCLGFEPTRPRPWGMFGFSWELPDGRQVNLLDGSDSIVLDVWSKRNADIERDEIRLGIDPGSEPEKM